MKVTNSSDRIKELLQYFNLSVPELSERTGVKPTALYNYVKGIREPKQNAIALISNSMKIDPLWLMGYDVEMYQSEFASALNAIKEHDDVKAVMESYIKADDMTKEMVKRLLGIK